MTFLTQHLHAAPSTWIALLLLITVFLSGCDAVFDDNQVQEPATTTELVPQEKFRHAHLVEQATRIQGDNKNGKPVLNLVFSVHPQKVLDRYKILDRYKVLDRYKILDRYEFVNTFPGFAISVEDISGSSDFDAFIELLLNDPDIAWFEPDFMVDLPGSNAATTNQGQKIPWSVAAIGGQTSWAVSGDRKGDVPNVDVFILDTGIASGDSNHDTDLHIVENIDFRDLNQQNPEDKDGHGTHIAGIIGAIDDADGLVGVAPGVKIHNYKVLNDEGGTDVSVTIAAIEHILSMKLSNPSTPMVVNMSLGENVGTPEYTALDQAILAAIDAGITIVISAGNEGIHAQNISPAHVAGAITVGSYDLNGSFSSFSNYGPMVDVLAPGEEVLSFAGLDNSGAMTNMIMSGTSMSAAHVTGAAALYLSQHPDASPAEVKQALLNRAKDIVTEAPSNTTTRTVWVGNVSQGAGTITHEWWNGISGTRLADLTNSPTYPSNPNGTAELGSFSAPSNWADNYGSRIHGYVHAPTTGNYTFWIASDDEGQLWLSTDDNPLNKRKIAFVSSWTHTNAWDTYPEQKSATIFLEAGKRYYIEALQKEGGGGDNLSVAWQIPGQPRAVIEGHHLSPADPEPAQVEPQNLSLNKPATQVETFGSATADKAVDGNMGSYTWTWQNQVWWEVDLETVSQLNEVVIWGANGGISDFHVFVSDVPFTSKDFNATRGQAGVGSFHYSGTIGNNASATIALDRTGRYLRIQRSGFLSFGLAEVQVMGHQ